MLQGNIAATSQERFSNAGATLHRGCFRVFLQRHFTTLFLLGTRGSFIYCFLVACPLFILQEGRRYLRDSPPALGLLDRLTAISKPSSRARLCRLQIGA